MQALRRTATSAARNGRTSVPRQTRRYAHGESAHGHHQTPVNEPLGMSFYLAFGAVPFGYLLYKMGQNSGEKSYWTQLISKYSEKHEEIARRNALHTTMKEQAGSDRFLFLHTKTEPIVDMKFPEIMNNSSPYNVVAGSQVNMDKVIEKMRREAYEDNEMKYERLRNNEVPSEQPLERVLGSRRFRGVEMGPVDPNQPGGVEYEKQRLNAAIR